jgi:Na+/proline symporter
MSYTLAAALGALALGSFVLAPRVTDTGGFFRGTSAAGAPPGLLTLVFSQVTTWVFARSLMNAATLGYYYGIAGALGYAAYYLSFLTGAWIVDAIRFRHGFGSIHDFLRDRFGRTGVGCFNFLVGIRLLSEVFANLLVIGIIFGAAGSTAYVASIAVLALVTLAYSMLGGLRASLRTDVFQMSVLIAVLVALLIQTGAINGYDLPGIFASSPALEGPGWVLVAVALLQVWSYPMHDPVMMDRGFLADRETTRKSFLHATLLGVACILAFGILGVEAGLHRTGSEDVVATLTRLLGSGTMILFSLAVIVSAVSTLDSTLASAAKLTVIDMRLSPETVGNGRIAMAAFMAGGLVFVFVGSKDLFDAVAVSGTASMFLAPVVFFSIWGGARVPTWCLVVAFVAAIGGSALYFAESGNYLAVMEPLTGIGHKYSKLLAICAAVLVVGCGAFAAGLKAAPRRA